MSEKITLTTLRRFKEQGKPFAMLTCYDYATAVLLQQAGVDSILVGDSLAQLMLGHKTTLSATMDVMIALSAAVRRGAPDVYLLGDMPFLSYQVSTEAAITNAGRFLVEAGCDAVKLEVDHHHVDLVATLSAAGIPVVAHMGYRPQAAGTLDKVVATRAVQDACQLVADSLAMAQAGACAILLECATTAAAKAVTERTPLPVISCGSGPHCDGQVLILHDMLGLPGAAGARFNKTYAQIGQQITTALETYVDDIHQRRFPDDQHSYHMKPPEQAEFTRRIKQLDTNSGSD